MEFDQTMAIEIAVLIVLLFLSAFFSSAETAFTTANKIRIRTLAEGNEDARAIRVLKIWDNQSKMLSTILVGNNIVNLSASSLATIVAVRLLGSYGAGIATFVVTFVVLVLGEITPKTLATIHAEKLVLLFSGIIYALMVVLTPIVWIVNTVSNVFLRMFRVDPDTPKEKITEGELKTIVDVSHEGGVIEEGERDMIYNLFHFNDSLAREIMVPRIDMVTIGVQETYEDLMQLYRENMLTRIPVYEDSNDNIIGFINMKDVLLHHDPFDFSIRRLLRTPYYTHEHKNTAELLLEMREQHVNIAIVLDEYGSAAGMVTMEDLLEEIVGEIRDEYDEDETDIIEAISETEYEVDGKANIDDINAALGLSLEDEDYDTIGGFVIGLSDAFPEKGQQFELEDGLLIRVDGIEHNRIDRLYLHIPEKQPSEAVVE